MKILFAITEAEPFIKTGGLGIVGGSLPFALQEQGVEIRVIMPKHQGINPQLLEKAQVRATFTVPLAWRRQECTLLELIYNNIHYYFLDNPYYFARSQCYGDDDEGEQYAFFSRGVLESIPYMGEFKPDILHCHDWHTALIPVFWRAFYGQDLFYHNLKTLFTIHNLKYQGIFPADVLEDVLGLSWDYFTPEKLEFRGNINYMKGGILYSDLVSTVSPTYAEEIQYSYFGEGLDGVIRKRKDSLVGILNGIPPREKAFKLEDKVKGKRELQQKLGLKVNKNIPVLCIISRLVEQKGLDLLLHVIDEIMTKNIQLVIMGTGEKVYEDKLWNYSRQYEREMKVLLTYEEELAH
ncbi:MAG: glycogen synthase, partial [Desulfitobacterium sp.]|nr:glycogen synthase [Desulfitobacterium sp.]